jgi:tryptophan synthase alpha chain
MNRIHQLFSAKRKNLLSVYFTAGFPRLHSTAETLLALQEKGVDMVEVGIPFSDPMADGAVIQEASTRALRNGMSLRLLFEQLESVRDGVRLPVVLMGYLNPIMQFGFEAFCRRCRDAGVSGAIIPDLPFADYMADYKAIADRHDLKIIMLITPETSEERIRLIDDATDGFIYMVSSASTTGAKDRFTDEQQAYFSRVAAMRLRNPLMVGFGVSNRTTYEAAAAHTAGCIIGSRFVRLLDECSTAEEAVERLVEGLKA